MNFRYTLANKIRTNLLLFTDREMRTKIPNINAIKKYYNNTLQIKNEELIYSNVKKDTDKNRIQPPKINIIRNEVQDKSPLFAKQYSQKIQQSLSKFLLNKQPKPVLLFSENGNIIFKNKNYKRKSDRKISSTMIYLTVGNTKKSAKSYLKELCNSLISKTNLKKAIFSRKTYLQKKNKIKKQIKKNRSTIKMSADNCRKNILSKSPSDLDSFKIIVFGY